MHVRSIHTQKFRVYPLGLSFDQPTAAMMRVLLPLLLFAAVSSGCLPYWVFTADTACFFRLERRCADSYGNLGDLETYSWDESFGDGSYLRNKTLSGEPSLSAACHNDFVSMLFIRSVGAGAYSLWYGGDKYLQQGAYPFTVYEGKWYQGLWANGTVIDNDKFVITNIDFDRAYVKQSTQPTNTKAVNCDVQWNSSYTLIAIAAGVVFLSLVVFLVLICRHKRTDF